MKEPKGSKWGKGEQMAEKGGEESKDRKRGAKGSGEGKGKQTAEKGGEGSKEGQTGAKGLYSG